MSESEDLRFKLPGELAAALRRTTTHTLNALHSLRVALREHVQDERSRGVTAAEIDNGLRDMISVAGDGADGDGHPPERVRELTAQVLRWSESFYSKPE